MNAHANPYLRTRVLTASKEELRLLLFEGALKFCRQAVDAIGRAEWETMYNALTRAQRIMLELSNSLDPSADPELCERLTALYTYIYRRLVDANMERDPAAVHEAIRLIDYERETWVMVMKKIKQQDGADAAAPDPAPSEPVDEAPTEGRPATVGRIHPAASDQPTTSTLSLEG